MGTKKRKKRAKRRMREQQKERKKKKGGGDTGRLIDKTTTEQGSQIRTKEKGKQNKNNWMEWVLSIIRRK